MTESEPGPPDGGKRSREEVMKRLAEMLKAGPPDLSGSSGPVSAGGFPLLPSGADEFDQESAAALLAVLGDFFRNQHKESDKEAGAGPSGRE